MTEPTFGYRSSPIALRPWMRWFFLAMAVFEVVVLVVGGLDFGRVLFFGAFLVYFLGQFVYLTWLRRVLVTQLRTTGTELVGTTATAMYRVDLARTPVTAIERTRGWRYRLVFADGTWLRVSIESRDWAEFVTALEAAQGSPIDQSAAGNIRTSGYWFSNDRAGYFVEVV